LLARARRGAAAVFFDWLHMRASISLSAFSFLLIFLNASARFSIIIYQL
jgi:hypothetical protein